MTKAAGRGDGFVAVAHAGRGIRARRPPRPVCVACGSPGGRPGAQRSYSEFAPLSVLLRVAICGIRAFGARRRAWRNEG
ncbi:hypothetical protein D9M68_89820 [compost metagenome]